MREEAKKEDKEENKEVGQPKNKNRKNEGRPECLQITRRAC